MAEEGRDERDGHPITAVEITKPPKEGNLGPNYRDQHERSQKIYSAVYLIKLVLQLGLLTLYICLLILPKTANEQQHDWWTLPANVSSSRQLFMMHYRQLTTVAHPFFFVLVHFFSMIFATLFVPLADLVPSLIYGHAATAVHALRSATQQAELNLDDLANQKKKKKEEQENNQNQEPADAEAAVEAATESVVTSSQIESDLHRIFSLYEGIRVMVKRADDQSRTDLLNDCHVRFFARLLEKSVRVQIVMQVVILIAFVIRIIISLKLMVRLHSASDPLWVYIYIHIFNSSVKLSFLIDLFPSFTYRRTAVTKVNLSKNRNELNRDDRDTLQCFLARLHTDYLTATPSGLY